MFVCGHAINNIALILTPRQLSFWTKLMSFLQGCSFAAYCFPCTTTHGYAMLILKFFNILVGKFPMYVHVFVYALYTPVSLFLCHHMGHCLQDFDWTLYHHLPDILYTSSYTFRSMV